MQEIFPVSIDAEGFAMLSWDLPGASMNVLNEAGIIELEAKIPDLIADPKVKGVVLTSAKTDFAGGMDLPTILNYKRRAEASDDPARMLFDFTMRIHRLLRLIERGGMDPGTSKEGKPFIWASPGTAVGIGMELALACHHRIAADKPAARLGLPEIKVGIFPGAGGTTRLIRMLGLMGASEYLLEGKLCGPSQAQKSGLIDAVVPVDSLLSAATDWLRGATASDVVKPWDRKGFKLPGGSPYSARGFPLFVGAMALAHGKSRGVYPAINAMLSAIYEGAQLPFDSAIRIEARYFTKTLLEPSAEAMIRTLFVNKQAIEKGAFRPKGVARKQVKRLGVIGAGAMGAGIADIAAKSGVQVVLLDRDRKASEQVREAVAELFRHQARRKQISANEMATILAHVAVSTDVGSLADCDLVIEAAAEDLAAKMAVLAQADRVLSPGAVLASSTSSLPISELARACQQPQRFFGVHFISPVDRMMLVEIIRGAETEPAALAVAFDFVRQLNKTPVIVNDGRSFYANRCTLSYGREGVELLAEGVAPAVVENAAKNAGMPVGPLQLIDETSLTLALGILREMRADTGADASMTPGEEFLCGVAEKAGRAGRKHGAGFYDYDATGRRAGLWSGLAAIAKPGAVELAFHDVRDRLIYIQVIEAIRAYQQGVIADIAQADLAAVLGWGFLPWSGGPFGWVDMTGPSRVLIRCEELATQYGQRFTPPSSLCDLVAAGEFYYARPISCANKS